MTQPCYPPRPHPQVIVLKACCCATPFPCLQAMCSTFVEQLRDVLRELGAPPGVFAVLSDLSLFMENPFFAVAHINQLPDANTHDWTALEAACRHASSWVQQFMSCLALLIAVASTFLLDVMPELLPQGDQASDQVSSSWSGFV